VNTPKASLAVRAYRFWLKEMRHILPPTLYFVMAFNLIVFTTNLLTQGYWFHLSGFLLATGAALVVGKTILVTDKFRLIDRFRGAPLIQPILYKTIFYTLVVLVVRLLEQVVHFTLRGDGIAAALQAVSDNFVLHRFVAAQIWIFTCFLIYCTATELAALLGEGQLVRLFFRHRSAQHRLTRRQHVRALMELSRLAEMTPREQLLDPATPQGGRLVSIVDALRRRPA
jgi:hypothetical protein